MENGNIVSIPKESINKICCGQVVVTLAVAVKELIENSLDAGATKIDIKFKEHGSELIEVIDNGSGILKDDFENITKMHTTSKLTQFEDLSTVSTYGFRGEALGSLCQLGKLSVHTYNQRDSSGTYLLFDSSGSIVTQEERARQVGTTIWVSQIFSRLHVRRVELLRNIKREFNKALQILTAYCLICNTAKITCYKIDSKGCKNVVLNNDCGSTLSQNISQVFGPQQLSSLRELPQIDAISNEILEEFRLNNDSIDLNCIKIEGLVSSCLPGQGRSSSDRQYLFVNHRPCEIPRLVSLINSLYKQYNRSQSPVFVLKIDLPIDSVDVNLAPDKRQIFLAHEKLVSAYLKCCLVELFDSQNVTGCDFLQMTLTRCSPSQSASSNHSQMSQRFNLDSSNVYSPNSTKFGSSNLSHLKRFSLSASDNGKNICPPTLSQLKRRKTEEMSDCKLPSIKNYFKPNDVIELSEVHPETSYVGPEGPDISEGKVAENFRTVEVEMVSSESYELQIINLTADCPDKGTPPTDSQSDESWRTSQSSTESARIDFELNDETLSATSRYKSENPSISECRNGTAGKNDLISPSNDSLQIATDSNQESNPPDSHSQLIEKCVRCVTIKFSLSSIRERLSIYKQTRDTPKCPDSSSNNSAFNQQFKAKINPDDNSRAEEELRTIFNKDNFQNLSVIGQFNRGFILSIVDGNIFIIDQHASDEKYNFERLQRGLNMNIQKLVIPKPLRLTVTQEEVVIDNMDVFTSNGFEFFLDDNGPLGNRLKLVSIPTNKNYTFGKDDIEEMIFVLSESGSRECKPSRIRQMLATQACRMSIMIGTVLTKSEMKKVLHHMSDMDQPWNCPHGRPTIRHILNLNMLTRINSL